MITADIMYKSWHDSALLISVIIPHVYINPI